MNSVNSMKKITLIFALILPSTIGQSTFGSADEVTRIRPGADPAKYSQKDLQKRVHDLEKAVQQLQERMLDLQSEQQVAKAKRMEKEKWTCNLQVQMRNYTSIEQTKAEAVKAVLKKCAEGEGRDVYCKKPRCYN